MKTDSKADGLHKLSVMKIFDQDSYQIPLYQRAYAWTDAEIHTLLVDIQDSRKRSQLHYEDSAQRNYYIGSLVVNTSRTEGWATHEVVDGQQRLTTLFVLLAVAAPLLGVALPSGIARSHLDWSSLLESKLTYEGRPDAREDLRRLAQRGSNAISSLNTDGIKNAAEVVLAAATQGVVEEGAGSTSEPAGKHSAARSPSITAADLTYLLEHVMIIRTTLPSGTDLNHYFEVMNTRGEQLEKHEILKARLISALGSDTEGQAIFARVWDACSILDRHIQVQFSTEKTARGSERARIFGDGWNMFIPSSGDDLFNALRNDRSEGHATGTTESATSHVALADVLRDDQSTRSGGDVQESEDESGSYGAIVDFPNLLLHALKIFRGEVFQWNVDIDSIPGHVRLEDKHLLEEFTPSRESDAGQPTSFDPDAARQFAFVLLKTRYLLDTYVIRTQPSTTGDQEENWVLHRAYGAAPKGTKGLQLSARNTFRVSSSDGSEAEVQRRIVLLQAMFQVTDTRRSSKYFLFHILQWLSHQDRPADIDGKEFVDLLESSARDRLTTLYSRDNLNLGTQVQNFLFNVLDYELWRLASDQQQDRIGQIFSTTTEVGKTSADALVEAAGKFRFRYRTSVEHFYPQEPAASEGHKRLPKEIVDQFGNLCIMSRSENSKRSNLMPGAKANEFASTGQSLNFQIMAAVAKKQWTSAEITEHGEAMVRLLEDVLSTHGRVSFGSSD